MDLAVARTHLQTALTRMNLAYGQVVFDEWAILGFGGKGGVHLYGGPRPDQFRKHLPEDVAPLRAAAKEQPTGVGDILFALEASGTRYDALMRLGETHYLVCNHTAKTITEIRGNAGWLGVQAVFFDLGEKFRSDPLEA